MSGFGWDDTPVWEVGTGTMLPKGNHVVEIVSAEKGKSSKQNPQVELEFGNAEGTIRDWLVITTGTFGKVKALAIATGCEPGSEEKAYFSQHNGEAPDSWVKRLVGKRLGIVVRDEDDDRNPGKTRLRVQGYVPADQITPLPGQGQGTNPNGTGAVASGDPGPASPHPAEQKDIPF